MTVDYRPAFFIAALACCFHPAVLAEETKPIVLELEAFTLTKARIETLQEASGKKVVVFEDRKSKAEATIVLPRGWYEGTLYVWAKDDASDSTHALIEADDYDAGVSELPVFPWETQKIAPCLPIRFRVAGGDQARRIVLRPDELGVKLDRLEIQWTGK